MNKSRFAKFAFVIGTAVTVITLASVDSRTPEQIEAARVQAAKDSKNTTLVFSAVKALQGSLRDPGSLQIEDAGVTTVGDNVCISYRAKNGFGGYTAGVAVGIGGKTLSTSVAAWNKHCAGKDVFVMTSAGQSAAN
jgi:hypothetical protein